MRWSLFVALAGAAVLAAPASAQWPPDHLKNVQALPADISIRALVDTMAGFTRALGVRCAYCHVGGETTPFDKLDFSSDSMPAKVKAREMLRMVTAINGDYLSKLVDRRQPRDCRHLRDLPSRGCPAEAVAADPRRGVRRWGC